MQVISSVTLSRGCGDPNLPAATPNLASSSASPTAFSPNCRYWLQPDSCTGDASLSSFEGRDGLGEHLFLGAQDRSEVGEQANLHPGGRLLLSRRNKRSTGNTGSFRPVASSCVCDGDQ